MPALFDQGFFVRKPAWHKEGVVLDYYPGREEAMRLAGHDWDVLELRSFTEYPNETIEGFTNSDIAVNLDGRGRFLRDEGYVSHVRSDTGALLHKPKDSFERIPNHVAYDVAEVLFDEGFEYETGVTLDGGKQCAITMLLNEPIQIPGDDSPIFPFGVLGWAHDGSGSLKARTTTIRVECANTLSAGEAEATKYGTDFTFRHTKNVMERIEDAKKTLTGARQAVDAYRELALELAEIEVTPEQRDLFVSTIIGDRPSIEIASSKRVQNNIERERVKALGLFMGNTVPEAHKLTGYGLWLAGGEYFDHLRNYRSQDSYVKRTLLTDNPAKANLAKTIREVVKV